MTARRHHPSCAAADGGNCTNCPQWPPMPVGRPVHQSDITCDECGETYVVTGETSEARERALATWPGCPCTPKTASEATAGEADASEVPTAEWTIGRRVVPASSIGPGRAPGSWSLPVERPRRPGPVSHFLRYLANGRLATWPFDAEDFTA